MRETRTHRDPLRGLLVTVRGQSEQNWETCCLEFSWGMWDSHCYIPTRYSIVQYCTFVTLCGLGASVYILRSLSPPN